jgi:hypothetical protein
LVTATPASAEPIAQTRSSCHAAGGEWDWYIPSGGNARYECILVFGNDHYAIESYDHTGDSEGTCWHYPDGTEDCYVND